ncbi:MAG: Fe-S cluster assembly protein SufD [Armatimonadetes bacterium]|nr:Fe-S cluster assembly protein SufD [Armatimonadota bacterium]
MPDVLVANNSYLRDFVGKDLGEPTEGPRWLQGLRAAAAERFAALGLPTRRDEEFRFTNVSPIAETPFRRACRETSQLASVAEFDYAGLTGSRLVFVNGHYAPEHSQVEGLPKGVLIGTLAEAMAADSQMVEKHLGHYARFQNHAFVALNTAALDDGAFVFLPRNAVIEEPIHLLFVSTATAGPTVSHPRTLILAGENSQATVVESYAGPADQVYFTNAVTEIVCAESAVVDHYKVQRESQAAFHIATMQVEMARGSNFSSHSVGLGGKLVRNDANALLGGEGGECTLNGVYLANGRQLMDNHTAIDHAMPHCNSHEVYKGILDGHARGVFNGKIFVRPDAQKTDAKQTNQTLLLSGDAQMNTKPQLEIFADDVRCTHGATIGQLSADALFYLRARGIPYDDARALLTYAFASDIVSRIKVEPIRAQLDHALLSERALEGLTE